MVANHWNDNLILWYGTLEEIVQQACRPYDLRLGGVPHIMGDVVAGEDHVTIVIGMFIGDGRDHILDRPQRQITVAHTAPVAGGLADARGGTARPTTQRLLAIGHRLGFVVLVQVDVRHLQYVRRRHIALCQAVFGLAFGKNKIVEKCLSRQW